jgi:hypothetical protein
LKAAQVAPQPPIVEACLVALLRERTLPRQDGTALFIMSQGVLVRRRVTGEERELRRANRVRGPAFLLLSPQRSLASNSGGIYAYP